MAATILDAKVVKTSEFVEEATFDTFPTAPTMLGYGGYATTTVKKTPVVEDFDYLKGAGDTNHLQATQSTKVSEAYEVTVEYKPTAWTMLPYMLCAATSATYAIGDTPYDVAVGVVMNDQYETLNGGIWAEWECTIEEDKAANVVMRGLFASSSGEGAVDYIGAGAHASSASGSPLGHSGVTAVLYDAAALSVVEAHLSSIKFGVSYPIKPVRDLSATNTSKIAGWALGPRNISVELGMSIDDMTLFTQLMAGAAHTLAFTALSKTFTFSNLIWKEPVDKNLKKDDIVGMTLTANRSVGLAIA